MDYIVFSNTPRDAPYVSFPNYKPQHHTDVKTFENAAIKYSSDLVTALLSDAGMNMVFEGPTLYAYWLNFQDAKERDDELRVGVRASNGEVVISSPCLEYSTDGRSIVMRSKHYFRKGPHYATLNNGKIIDYQFRAVIAGGIQVEYWQDAQGSIMVTLIRYDDVGEIMQRYAEGSADYYWHTPPDMSQSGYVGEVKWATYFPELADLEASDTVQRAFLSAETTAAFVEKSKSSIADLCNFPPMPIDFIKRIIGS